MYSRHLLALPSDQLIRPKDSRYKWFLEVRSSDQNFCLQNQGPRVRFPALSEVVGLERIPLSYLGFGLEYRDYQPWGSVALTTRPPSAKVDTNFTEQRWQVGRYFLLAGWSPRSLSVIEVLLYLHTVITQTHTAYTDRKQWRRWATEVRVPSSGGNILSSCTTAVCSMNSLVSHWRISCSLASQEVAFPYWPT
jgi:hypothetical protein